MIGVSLLYYSALLLVFARIMAGELLKVSGHLGLPLMQEPLKEGQVRSSRVEETVQDAGKRTEGHPCTVSS